MNEGQVNTLQPMGSMGVNAAQGLTREQVDLIKTTICKGATDDELSLFVQTCNRTGLDPFARQVFAVKRWDSKAQKEVMAIQVSIDGFRLISERSGKYAGQLGPYWTDDGTTWLDVWLKTTPPKAAKVGILRRDFQEPLWAVATWDQYAQKTKDGKLSGLWGKMGPLMLAKCAESLGRRTAFPQELSGLYTVDEMGQAEMAVDPEPRKAQPRDVTPSSTRPATTTPTDPPATSWSEADVKQAFDILEETRKAFVALGHGERWPGYLDKKQVDMARSTPEVMLPLLRAERDKCQAKLKAAMPVQPEPESAPVEDLDPLSSSTPDTPGEDFSLTPGSEEVPDPTAHIPANELNTVMVQNWNRISEILKTKGNKPSAISQAKTTLMSRWTVGVDPSEQESFERAIVRGQLAWFEEQE